MVFRFKRRELIAAAFTRIAGEQISAAIAALEASPDAGVHEARKGVKRLRGLLRLFRRALPEGSYERENTALHTAARSISGVRDAQVLLAVFESTAKGVTLPGVAAVRREFAAAVKKAGEANHHPHPSRTAIATLRTVRARLPILNPACGWAVLSRCLRTSYRRARRAHATARADLSMESLHRWRRRCKDFQYQMQLLRKIDPDAMKPRVRKAEKLTALLGDDHDLAVLDRHLVGASHISAELRDQLHARIARRRKKLQRRAFALGSGLFFEKPSVVVKDLGRLWKQWRRRGK